MATTYRLELDAHDFGQVLDGLEQRAGARERTAAHYRRILHKLDTQAEAQR